MKYYSLKEFEPTFVNRLFRTLGLTRVPVDCVFIDYYNALWHLSEEEINELL